MDEAELKSGLMYVQLVLRPLDRPQPWTSEERGRGSVGLKWGPGPRFGEDDEGGMANTDSYQSSNTTAEKIE